MRNTEIASYMVFIIPIVVGGLAQIVKFILYAQKHGWNWSYAMTHGHMPSAHTAFVISLVTSVGFYDGINSGEFAVSIILALIVIDDAVRLRVYMGDQGRYLNALIKQLNISEKQFPRLKERIGHRVSEVLIGGIGGFVVTVILISFVEIFIG